MRLNILKRFTALLPLLALSASAEIILPAVISSNMVLQRNQPIPIWGQANPGEKVSVKMHESTAEAVTDSEGNWSVTLPAMEASFDPATLLISGENTLELTNILVGEVWVCSGQSNMEWPLADSHNGTLELLAANDPTFRLFRFENKTGETPLFRTDAQWETCTPTTARRFSGVGFYFGRYLQQVLKVPVGMIHTAWGGTPAEAWIRKETLESNAVSRLILNQWETELSTYPERLVQWKKAVEEWDENEEQIMYHTDPGAPAETLEFLNTDFDDTEWGTSILPAVWETKLGLFDGAVWYRKTVEIPEAWMGKSLLLELGPVDDFDVTYFNGTEVGAYTSDKGYMTPRSYPISAALSQSKTVTITIRVFDHFGDGGLNGTATQYKLTCPEHEGEVSLAGNWKHHVELKLTPSIGEGRNGSPSQPRGPDSSQRPANLANGMLAPVVPFAIRGAIWYQGENNTMRSVEYRTLLPMLITDWRNWWNQGDFPFGVVQLANFMDPEAEPTDDGWAHLRDAQLFSTKTTPNTGLTVTIDIGERDDIHPKNKQEVGSRLARWALADVYETDLIGSGPVYQSFEVQEDHIVCIFSDIANGLDVREGGELAEFSIIGKEGVWKWAKAKIIGTDRVKVWSEEVLEPIAVRYAWANNPSKANLVNSEDLPASPFRTDNWKQGSVTP